MRNLALALATGFGIAACSSSAALMIPSYGGSGPNPRDFIVCHGYGCAYRSAIALDPAEWQRARADFDPPARDAAAERRQVARAIATLERAVGQRTGTAAHQRRQTLNAGDGTQLDCVDEAVNTWTYLTMLERDGLLRHHAVGEILHRNAGLGFDPHNTATLIAKDSGERFAVDPNLIDAPLPPPIVPLAGWLGPWPPRLSW
jgi:hypothetical protein